MSEKAAVIKGHGHVTPNADGYLARCGGPKICKVCMAELAALKQPGAEMDERAEFEREVVERYGYTWASIYSRRQGQGYSDSSLCMAWIMWKARAALSAPDHSEQVRHMVPAGWKLVPVEPTPEMISAAEEAHMPFGDMDIALRCALLAAPSAGSQKEQE